MRQINKRIKTIAETQFEQKKDFAEFLGWKANYLSKILGGQNIGLTPVVQILHKMPNIDARWLLFGEGTMFVKKH